MREHKLRHSVRAKTRQLILVVLAGTLLLFTICIPKASAIVGGVKDVTTNNVVVALHRVGRPPFCTGTIVAATWVVTAAHCVWDDTLGQVNPYAGLLQVSTTAGFSGSNAASSPVRGVAVHPSYSGWRTGSDIALIKVDDVFGGLFSPIASADEITAYSDSFSSVIASGFGQTSNDGAASSVALETSLTLLSRSACSNSLPADMQIFSATLLCANGTATAATCSGDSGGPLFLNTPSGRKLAGATSFGSKPCTLSRQKFTNVSSFIQFLNSYGIGLPATVIPGSILAPSIPKVPELPPLATIFQSPSLPVFNSANPPVAIPKFSISRTFQLLLEKDGRRCLVDIDGPIGLANSKVKVFVGKRAAKPYLARALNSFGDTVFTASLGCDSIRNSGVFIVVQKSSVRVKVIE
jgi:hypothetical protein